ncbi:hypothetical protein UFOVP901_5 [uncultured Caudovirales phage]|uniref:Uncharacterized protein n=1 Tax=uncultured Caudovirales phage TaxID=2100421 RepID=A0A6J5PD75_9CAUD|nr:hypothetical protein UFOVP901_5 [uncultured Caudovirales phage]
MSTAYGITALLLFLIHLSLRGVYRNSVTRCAIWALFWPLDVAICVREWIRQQGNDGGDINNSAMILKMRERK